MAKKCGRRSHSFQPKTAQKTIFWRKLGQNSTQNARKQLNTMNGINQTSEIKDFMPKTAKI